MADFGMIRQWCETCGEATPSWIDAYGETRCAKHDGPPLEDDDDD